MKCNTQVISESWTLNRLTLIYIFFLSNLKPQKLNNYIPIYHRFFFFNSKIHQFQMSKIH